MQRSLPDRCYFVKSESFLNTTKNTRACADSGIFYSESPSQSIDKRSACRPGCLCFRDANPYEHEDCQRQAEKCEYR